MNYQTLSTGDKLSLAQGRLRGLESDHFNLTLTTPASQSEADRVKQLESYITEVEAVITQLQEQVKTEAAAAAPQTGEASP